MNLSDIVRQFRKNRQDAWEEEMRKRTVSGHPSIEAHNAEGRKMIVTVCAECESVRTMLYLSEDRWYCTKCRSSGDARPTQIALSKPSRRE